MKKSIFLTVLMVLIASGLLPAQDKPERIHPALIVIDVQKAFMPMMDDSDQEMAIYAINAYIDLFRKHGFPVIRVYHSSEEYGVTPGTDQFEFDDRIKVLPEDPRVIKTYGNGFNKTDLDKVIKENKCNTLFLCGLSSVGCVLATYMGSKDLDYTSFLIKDAMMSHNAQYTNEIEDIFEAVGYDAVTVMLNSAEK
jgi:nicotinamidase-related amidase